jgi:phosphoglycerate dehydrogenase-like enzyme
MDLLKAIKAKDLSKALLDVTKVSAKLHDLVQKIGILIWGHSAKNTVINETPYAQSLNSLSSSCVMSRS